MKREKRWQRKRKKGELITKLFTLECGYGCLNLWFPALQEVLYCVLLVFLFYFNYYYSKTHLLSGEH